MRKTLCLLLFANALYATESNDRIPPSIYPTRLPSASLGVEFATSYKSLYLFRGYQIGEQVWGNQFSTAISLTNDFAIELEALYLHGFANDIMSQSSAVAELQYFINDNFTMGYRVDGQFFTQCDLPDSIDNALHFHYSFNLSWNFNGEILWNSASSGWYYLVNFTYQPLITTRTAWATTIQISAVSHYQNDTGIHELSLRTGPIIRMSDHWVWQPFIAAGHYFHDKSRHHLFTGITFSLQF